MKTLLAIIILFISFTHFSHAAFLSSQEKYDCSVAGKPKDVDWVKVMPSYLNNGRVILRFDDSYKAHVVRIKYWSKDNKKSVLVKDDGWEVFDNLKNGKKYRFKIRGESNCGVGDWSKTVIATP